MKLKNLLLLLALSSVCVIGGACNKEQPQNGGGGDVTPPSGPVYEETKTVISVNQSSVIFCVGETFTLTAELEGDAAAKFTWSVDGDAAADVVTLSQVDNAAVITAVKVGTTKLVAAVEQDGHLYFKTVDVTVKQKPDVTLALSSNVGFNNDGYHVQLSTLPVDGAEISLTPLVSAYKDNKTLPGVYITWESEDTGVAKMDGNTIVSVSEGSTRVVGSCTVEGKQYSVAIAVDVVRPTVQLPEYFVVETENLSTYTVASAIKGTVKDVLYDGKTVGEFDAQTGKLTLNKSQLPTLSAKMGDGKQLLIETNLASYAIKIDLYTKILKTKADLDGMATISKRASYSEPAIWDGYFVLGDDIEYNAQFVSKIADLDSLWQAVEGNWSNGGLYGFRGVFDGKGHNVEGISIDNGDKLGSIFGVLHIDGVVKNVSFTKASVAANSSLVCGAGGGTVENVYIQYNSIGKGAQKYEGDGSINTHCASFFGFKEPTATANVSNCVIDVTGATFNENASIKLVGSQHAAIKNVFVIGGSEELRKKSNATLSFYTMVDFMQDNGAQSRYKKFGEDFWSLTGGVPIPQVLYEDACAQDVSFEETVSCLVSGTSYQFALSSSFVKIESNNENVKIESGIATVLPTVTNGETVTITATSLFDESKTASFTCLLAAVNPTNCVDLTGEDEVAYYDLTVDRVYFAELASKVTGEVLYFVDTEFVSASFARDGEPAKTLIAVTADKFYKFNCLTVTKAIESAEDLDYLRRDYTVSSYNNSGCYDGKLTGTFVLLNDVDCTGVTFKNTGRYWENSRGFAGTLDGRGYTISNLSIGENGLFGALTYATIKNVNFTGVRLLPADQGVYVALFASRVFNTVIENVSVEFAEIVAGTDAYHTSGLLFYEVSFDSLFKDLTIDISKASGVSHVAGSCYKAETPYLSDKESVYEGVTLIVASLDEIPKFAYASGGGNGEYIEYPDGVFVKDVNGNVKE